MARITVNDYRILRGVSQSQLKDEAIEIAIRMAAGRIDALAIAAPELSVGVLKDAELLLALYFGSSVDRRKTSEGVPPSSTSYETIPYLEYLRTLLGDKYALLGDIDGTTPTPATWSVITVNEC